MKARKETVPYQSDRENSRKAEKKPSKRELGTDLSKQVKGATIVIPYAKAQIAIDNESGCKLKGGNGNSTEESAIR
jgi:hypothetical protein